MSDLQLASGIYIIGAHIGFRTVLTATPHAVQHGRPVIAAPELIPPITQEWLIERATEDLPGQYHLRPAYGPANQYLNYTDENAYVREGNQVAWRIQPTPFGIQIVSDKDLVLRAEHVGGHILLAPEDDTPNEAWTLHRIR
ncbi:hypothetical protein [Streptomyces spectabilis]|uniref:Ricin B lectin domain-containing protein n=1 Tax=Streptomyces spectabilis TaxID=68270 RepID=A0A5P2XD97_STRST|nr:hypothetical protein [Streptomyces spectabilis]MBB5105230.1 hypothetical protein [Streptomyces spectabilis]MCI3905955.1 hypothetical protein [Streptomyces spectabilis]QEV62863.1 hypothetical protein CP982_32600 [Streptomyces spectabilis]GGV05692.1 hypothetical protein GCM10010245_11810 [Streptomyces spectabilis]